MNSNSMNAKCCVCVYMCICVHALSALLLLSHNYSLSLSNFVIICWSLLRMNCIVDLLYFNFSNYNNSECTGSSSMVTTYLDVCSVSIADDDYSINDTTTHKWKYSSSVTPSPSPSYAPAYVYKASYESDDCSGSVQSMAVRYHSNCVSYTGNSYRMLIDTGLQIP